MTTTTNQIDVGVNGSSGAQDRGTPCMEDIREMLATVGERMTTGQVLNWISAHGKKYSESTLTKTLIQMTKLRGELTNATDSHGKGYGLLSWTTTQPGGAGLPAPARVRHPAHGRPAVPGLAEALAALLAGQPLRIVIEIPALPRADGAG
jgi:hypothetical protein